jgi:uncharacterized protein YjeT (DUF2065 family)
VEALLPSVQPQVCRQAALSAGAVIAVRTVEALLPSVHKHVSRQVALIAGAVTAVLTLVGFLPSVQPQVHRQVALLASAVTAVLTLVGLLPSVHPQMLRQVALVGGFEIAVLAHVLHHHLAACAPAMAPLAPVSLIRVMRYLVSHAPQWPTRLRERNSMMSTRRMCMTDMQQHNATRDAQGPKLT